jgi:adenylate kinase family enzyme
MRKQANEAEKRTDLDEEAIRTRLKFYKDTIYPIVKEYEKRGLLLNVDASPSIEEVRNLIAEKLDKIRV